MRQRSVTQRIFTALFGIWFSLLVTEPVPMRACPMHDGPMAQAAAHHAAMTGSATEGANLHVAMPHASSALRQPATNHPEDHGTHQCLCLGCCAGVSALSLPTSPSLNLQATITATQARRIDAVDVLCAATRFAHALPFANGPPDQQKLVS